MPVERFSSGGMYEDEVGYSRVVVASGYAGSTGWTAGTTAMVNGAVAHPGNARGQALVAFQAALFALERAGFSRADVVQTRMYVVHLPVNAEEVGRAHAQLFATIRPVATMVGVTALVDPAMLVEVEVVAWRPDDEDVA
jgi:enamine deaminase RidA (YjgF/YER057c/UK114 family)